MAKSKAKKKEAAAPPANPKPHTRKAKPAEEDRIEKTKRLACSYLEQSQGLDPQTALDVVESMSPDDVMALIMEANTATMEAHPAPQTGSAPAPSAAPTSPVDAPEDDGPAPDFMTIPALAAHETFSEKVIDCIEAATAKNDSEKKYKSLKKDIITILHEAGQTAVEVFQNKLKVYTGHSRSLSEIKLLEKGVSIDIINECWVDTPYDDVRITKPAAPKGAK